MPIDTQKIMDEAAKLGELVAQHPAVARYKQAQKAVEEDPEAARLMADFERQLETLGRQQQAGQAITDTQRQQLEALQNRIISHIKIKAMNMAQVEFVDLLRRITQTIQAPLQDRPATPSVRPAAGAPRPA